MPRSLASILLAGGLLAGWSSGSPAQDSSTFDQMAARYEEIRQSLLNDSTDGVAAAAERIGQALEALEADPGRVGDDLRALLPELRSGAADLAEATTVADARRAFGLLSKAMVRYRRLVPDPTPVVAFCSMAQQVWLQPKGEIGNPYYGQSMARCGEIVSE